MAPQRATLDQEPNDRTYKSPTGKLVRFFEHSRDRWKANGP